MQAHGVKAANALKTSIWLSNTLVWSTKVYSNRKKTTFGAIIMATIKKLFFHQLAKNSLFWLCLFSYYVLTVDWEMYLTMEEVIATFIIKVSIQILTYLSVTFIIQHLLNKDKPVYALVLFIAALLIFYTIYILCQMFYLEAKFPESYVTFYKVCPDSSFYGRLTNFQTFISKSLFFLNPTFILLAFSYYKEQQRLSKLNQEKKTGELKALKNQLNPHFLFNTLNNLYALSLKKSDKAPEVISKLSDILDYMLYRCDETFVSIHKEIELIQNYLALEKIRYSDRVDITFTHSIDNGAKIAPLLLLTFIENAFKHGVVQELNMAKINIDIVAKNKQIKIIVMNTKPKALVENDTAKSRIGLSNVKQQLALIYQNEFDLKMDDTAEAYTIELILPYK
jgi:sensor histidine kinase YesM